MVQSCVEVDFEIKTRNVIGLHVQSGHKCDSTERNVVFFAKCVYAITVNDAVCMLMFT